MSNGDWRDGKFAIGLVVGIGLTLIFCFWFLGVSPAVQQKSIQEDSYQHPKERVNQEQNLLPWFEHDRTWVTSKDTLAQWAMALFGVIATCISAWAVILLKKTLDATRDMATDQRKIGHAQSRAWVSIQIESCFLHRVHLFNDRYEWRISATFSIRNTGYEVANGIEFRAAAIKPRTPQGEIHDAAGSIFQPGEEYLVGDSCLGSLTIIGSVFAAFPGQKIESQELVCGIPEKMIIGSTTNSGNISAIALICVRYLTAKGYVISYVVCRAENTINSKGRLIQAYGD